MPLDALADKATSREKPQAKPLLSSLSLASSQRYASGKRLLGSGIGACLAKLSIRRMGREGQGSDDQRT